jgi:pimeloyl-ACP methyl ester carboxylesterase
VDAQVTPTERRVPVRGIELSVREWPADERPFLLVHGLASNARTWDGVARRLNAAGHHVVAVDQRGHGLSDKPDGGYGFPEVAADLEALISELGLEQPIIAGQSWGGNVVLEFAASRPAMLHGLVLVDGGFIDLSSQPGATWEKIAIDLKPPPLIGTPLAEMLQRMRTFHPDWSEEQIEMQMGNFETRADGTIAPWLTLDRHMLILRSLWDERPSEVFPKIKTPTLIAAADRVPEDRLARKQAEVARAEAAIEDVRVRWFIDAVHDIHVQRPVELAGWMLSSLTDGFFDRKVAASA